MERHVPVLRSPTLDVVQTRSKKVGVYVLVVVKDDFGLYLDLIRPLGATFFLPNLFSLLKIGRCGSCSGGEVPVNGHIEEHSLTVLEPLKLATVMRLQPLFGEPQLLRNPEIVGVADNHPKIVGHSYL